MEKKLPKITVSNVFAFILFLFSTLFIVICINKYSDEPDNDLMLNHTAFSGIYTINQNDFSYTIPEGGKLWLDNIKEIGFKIRFDEEIPKETQINLYIDNVNVEVYKNDYKIYSYNTEKQKNSIASAIGGKWISFHSPGITYNDRISIILKAEHDTIQKNYLSNFLGNISQGSYYSLLLYQFEANLPQIVISLVTFIIGFVLLVVLATFKIMKSPIEIGNLSCAMVIILGGLASFINYDYITLIFGDSLLLNIVDYLNLLFLMLFILFYIRIYIHTKTINKAIDFFIYSWTIIIIGFFIYQGLGLSDIIFFTEYIVNVAIVMLGFIFLFLIIEYRDCKGSIVTLNFTLLFIATMIIEAYNKSTNNDFIYRAFRLGVLIFSITHFLTIMIKTQNSFIKAARAEKMENELIQSKISIMLSQIQPHFLYNTLVVIRQLCDINPKTAKEAITEFATYLRGNLDSLTLNSNIPFEKEMEHIENYVSLEKKRFGDKINLEYDIECLDFDVPSLTVQTIVENAIRHGITKRKEGGTVTIRTRETKKYYEIEVHDNGVGMDLTKPPEYSDNRSHIGLDNVRKRVESICNGEVLFNSTPNIGTTVYMSIPKPKENTEKKK
ncbi:MAG: histidine kinase [Acutalibacteraceae bacterium]|nr:histidine kinase [Acutalibacteraceae bacterium]